MILQNIIWKDATEETKELYCREQTQINSEEKITIESENGFVTDTYMNLFDIEIWRKYTNVENVFLRLNVQGSGKVFLRTLGQEISEVVIKFCFDKRKEILLPIPREWKEKVYFEIRTDEKVNLYKACYETKKIGKKTVKIAIVICTYKREQSLKQLLREVKKAKQFFRDKLEVYVVDNASELKAEEYSWVHLFHNPNTGGSGGFSRGMEEVVKRYKDFNATHVLLMDDDVVLQQESIFRLFSLLSFIKTEYQQEIVAGRMFRMDRPWIQYTAAEIWNGGNLQHIGFEADMCQRENLKVLNDNTGAEYSGWWFCCIPYEFVKDYRPLPFFLHCDDVEYGLRHGGTPIILNGIQVWHETYEYRQSPVVAYYDMRNSLIVNAMYGRANPDQERERWKKSISQAHIEKDYMREARLIKALLDFLKGPGWFFCVDIQKKQRNISKNQKNVRYANKFKWRIADLIFNVKEKRVYEVFSKCSNSNMQ